MVTPEEAWERLEAALEPLTSERVERRTGLGRRLAAPLAATVDVPPTDVSAMDGYCLTAAAAAGDRWPVAGVIAAGDPPGFELPPGRAARIMTGAPVPTTAETVVPVENTDGGREEVALLQDAAAGLHIRRQGEILASGDPRPCKAISCYPGHDCDDGLCQFIIHWGYLSQVGDPNEYRAHADEDCDHGLHESRAILGETIIKMGS